MVELGGVNGIKRRISKILDISSTVSWGLKVIASEISLRTKNQAWKETNDNPGPELVYLFTEKPHREFGNYFSDNRVPTNPVFSLSSFLQKEKRLQSIRVDNPSLR